MIKTLAAATLILGGLTVAAPAQAASDCDPTTNPAQVARAETSGPIVIIRATVTTTETLCLQGSWKVIGQHRSQYEMYAADSKRPCATYTRQQGYGAGVQWMPWKSTGRATNC